MQTMTDAVALKAAMDALRKPEPDRGEVLAALKNVNMDLFGWVPLTGYIEWMSLDTCNRMFELYKPMEGTWGYWGKLSPMANVYGEYLEIKEREPPDYQSVRAALEGKYETLLKELKARLEKTAADINEAADILEDIR